MTKLVDSERAARLMAAKGIDILVGTGYINFGYLSGYFTHFGRDYPGPLVNGAPLVRFAGLPRDQDLTPFLITYPGEEGDLLAQGSWIEERIFWGPRYHVPGRPAPLEVREDPVRCLADALEERRLATGVIGIDQREVSVRLMQQLQERLSGATFVDAYDDFRELRMIKTPEEVRRLRGAVRGAERGHRAVRESIQAGMTGRQVAAIAHRAVVDEYTDRYIIHVCCGPGGATVLAPTEAKLKSGELVSVDVGSIHRDYIGDLFRVYALGEPPADAVRIHQSLDQVNALMIEAVKPGIAAADLYHLGTEAMKERGLEMALDFVGHGIGLDVHELPNLVATDVTVLQENMVIVLELATRRFDLGHFSAEVPLLVTRQGCEVLTELPYTLTVIGS